MIEENIKIIQANIEKAALKSGRNISDITLMAVTKTFDAEDVSEALSCGLVICGESKIQEAKQKIPQVVGEAKWHMIGHLQRNKVKDAVALFDMLGAVDSMRLLVEIDKRAKMADKVMPVLLEVNISGEESKFGFSVQEIEDTMSEVMELSNVKVEGFMTMAPYSENEDLVRSVFSGLRQLRDLFRIKYNNQELFPVLSMGMSHDYEIAIEEGATLVRVGSAIFGGRYYG